MRRPAFAGRLRLHGGDLSRLQRLLDPVLSTALFVALQGPAAWDHPELRLEPWMWVLACSAGLLPLAGLYASYRNRNLWSLSQAVISGWLLLCSGVLSLSFITKTTASFSRFRGLEWAGLTLLLLLVSHVGVRMLLRYHRSRGGNSRAILYWGMPQPAAAFAQELRRRPWMGLTLEAWFGPQAPDQAAASVAGLPAWGGRLPELRHWLDSHSVDRIVFSHVGMAGVEMGDVLQVFGDTALPVSYAPAWALPSMAFKLEPIGSQFAIELWGGQQLLTDRQLKRVFDVVLAGLALLLLSPLLLLIAVAVMRSSAGPVLFSQDRYGLDGRRFRIHKFRTMRVLEPGDEPGLRQASRHDPRITPLGAVLRRWSLDELPQLFNVLAGEMSLVGPRPHAVAHNELYRRQIPGYMQRHAFKPGITGLAQVEGWRGETSTPELMARRIDADLRYQRSWSLWLDIKILIKTLLRLRSPNAY